MKSLSEADQRHLETAQVWFMLGGCQDANEELVNITPQFRAPVSRLIGPQTALCAVDLALGPIRIDRDRFPGSQTSVGMGRPAAVDSHWRVYVPHTLLNPR